jgi:hypothetical protein
MIAITAPGTTKNHEEAKVRQTVDLLVIGHVLLANRALAPARRVRYLRQNETEDAEHPLSRDLATSVVGAWGVSRRIPIPRLTSR